MTLPAQAALRAEVAALLTDLPAMYPAWMEGYAAAVRDVLALLDAETGTGWLPIETAPKDGRKVLVYDKSWCGGEPQQAVSYWQRYKVRDGSGPLEERGGWCGVTYATHWQPLPAPPMEPVTAPAQEPR